MKLAAATVLVLLSLAAPALAKTETATLGSVRAELSYQRGDLGAKHVELKVFDADELIVDKTIKDSNYFSPVGYNTGYQSVRVRDLDGDGTGEAIFDLYTGGAHCCYLTYIFRGTEEIERNWFDPGYRIKGGDLITADADFIYRWSSYAASLPPLQVFQLTSDGHLTDVTGERPAMLRHEIRRFRRYYRQAVADFKDDPVFRELIKSSVGAIAADRCHLNDCAAGYAFAQQAVDKGYLGRHYVPRLRAFLQRKGYDN